MTSDPSAHDLLQQYLSSEVRSEAEARAILDQVPVERRQWFASIAAVELVKQAQQPTPFMAPPAPGEQATNETVTDADDKPAIAAAALRDIDDVKLRLIWPWQGAE